MAKYSKRAGEKVEKAMHEKKRGELRSGRSGKKVTCREQAIAIGLSEARKEGAKVPQKKGTRSSGGGRSKAVSKKGASKAGRKSTSRTSSSGRKSASGGRSGSAGRSTKSGGGRKSASQSTSRGGGRSRSKSSKLK